MTTLHQVARRLVGQRAPTPRRSKRRGEMNATEARYAREVLAPLHAAGEIVGWGYETLSLVLSTSPRVTYRPDFVLYLPSGRFEVIEVKGSWRAKNARDSRTRLRIAAGRYPEIRFRAAIRIRVGWKHEEIR